MRRIAVGLLLGLLLLIGVPARADAPTDEEAAADLRSTATAFLRALDAGADEVLEVAFAPTVKLTKLEFESEVCAHEFGRKRSVKRGRARLARCLFPADMRPDASTSLTILRTGKVWEVIVSGMTLQFRRRSGRYVIVRIIGPAPVSVASRDTTPATPHVGIGKGTGVGVDLDATGSVRHGVEPGGRGTGGGGNVEGDFVSHGTGGGRPSSGSGPRQIALVLGTTTGELGEMTADEVLGGVKAKAGILKACYQKELNRDPALAGTVVVTFTIDADGAVKTSAVDVARSTLANAEVHACIQRVFMRMKFPAKNTVKVTFPLVFR